jgi:hypothetical protein
MTVVNETIALAVVGLLGASVVVGTVVAVKKVEPMVSVESNRDYPPIPIKKPVASPKVDQAPPASPRIQSVSKEIMDEDPSLSKEEVIEAVEKADRLDQIEQRIDEVVVEQRKLSERIEVYISKQGPEK